MEITQLREILLNVPIDVLSFLSKQEGLDASGQTKEDKINNLIKSASELDKLAQVKSIANQYRYAGRTAIDWFEYVGQTEPPIKTLNEIEEILVENFTTDVFKFGRFRPPLEKDPKLIFAELDRDRNQVIFMFAYNGPKRRILVNYEPQVDYPTFFDYAVIKLNPFVIEVRGNFRISKSIQKNIAAILDLNEALFKRIEIKGDNDISSLQNELNAHVQLARHQAIIGDYDWIEVVVDEELGNLDNSEHYKSEIAIAPSKRKIFTFDYEYSFGLVERVTLEINTELGRFWFRSSVGEEVIQYVLDSSIKICRERDS